MAKRFKADEIMQMAVGLIPSDPDADLDLDGKVTASDARYVMREDAGLLPLDTTSRMAGNIVNRILKESSSFSYDADSDPLFSQYKKQYERQGSLAAEDIMGRASAQTGGYGNSYASKIAADKMSEYSALTAEKGEELEEKAYKRHLDNIDSLYSLYSLMSDEEKKETERQKAAIDFAVLASGMGDDSFIKALGIEPEDDDFQKLKDRAELFAKYGDYSALEELGIDTSFLTDSKKYDYAELLAKYGDYSALGELGVDTSRLDSEEKRDIAELFAKYGDYSALEALGMDTSRLTSEEKYELAQLFAKYGDYSLLKSLGVDTTDRETEEYYDRLIKKQKVW